MHPRIRTTREASVGNARVVPSVVLAQQDAVREIGFDEVRDEDSAFVVCGPPPDPVQLDPAFTLSQPSAPGRVGLGLGVDPDEAVGGNALMLEDTELGLNDVGARGVTSDRATRLDGRSSRSAEGALLFGDQPAVVRTQLDPRRRGEGSGDTLLQLAEHPFRQSRRGRSSHPAWTQGSR